MRLDYAIVFVADMARSVRFYRDILELPLRLETSHWTEFATDAATLALHLSEGAGTADDADAVPPGRCRPGMSTPDLTGFHARMLAHGVPCVQPPTERFGARIAQYLDPDGLGISVSELRDAG
jgi:lactoylglutathione lyase